MCTYYLYFYIGTRKSLGFKNDNLLGDSEVTEIIAGITENKQ